MNRQLPVAHEQTLTPAANGVGAHHGAPTAPTNLPQRYTQPPNDLSAPHVDWHAIPHLKKFYGRQSELTQLENWLLGDQDRLVTILGMGGQGKTSVAAKLVRTLATPAGENSQPPCTVSRPPFTVILWRSLLNAPPLSEILQSWLQQLSNQRLASLPPLLDEQLALLLPYLQQQRVLLVLDNLESLLQEGIAEGGYTSGAGTFRPGYEGYQELLRCLGEGEHQSCLLITSREKPAEVSRLEEDTASVRSLQLEGLAPSAAQAMLQAQGLSGSSDLMLAVTERYSGNPLALALIAQTIWELFAGDLTTFTEEGVARFGDIHHVLDQQFARLSPVEREILFWLAIEREPSSFITLRNNLIQPEARRLLVDALRALLRRSLLEKQGDLFALQNVVLEYFTARLTQMVAQEFESTAEATLNPLGGKQIAQSHLNRFALVKAQSKEYVRESQVRMLLQPVAEQLLANLGKPNVEKRSKGLLHTLRTVAPLLPGYMGANLLNLLLHLAVDLKQYDFSQIAIWQANLRGVRLAAVNFTEAAFKETLFTEPFSGVMSLAFWPDSQTLAAGTSMGSIFLWRLTDYRLERVLLGHTERVFIALDADGTQLASASADGTLRLWNIVNLTEAQPRSRLLCQQPMPFTAVAFSPTGETIASGSDDGAVRLWAWATEEPGEVLYTQAIAVSALTFSPDGQTLASAGNGVIYLWDVAQQQLMATYQDHTNIIWGLAFSPNGQTLASTSSDQTVRLWTRTISANQQEPRWTSVVLLGHTAQVYSVAFSRDGKTLASSSFDQTMRCQAVLGQHKSWVRAVTFSPDGQLLASGSNEQTVCLWNIDTHTYGQGDAPQITNQLRYIWVGHTSLVRSVAFSKDGQLLASGHADQLVRLWNVQTGMVTHSLAGHVGLVYAVAFSPDGHLLASADNDGVVRLWAVATGDLVYALPNYGGGLRALAFSQNGATLAVGGNRPWVQFWDTRTGHLRRTLRAPLDMIWSIVFSPDGHSLLTGTHGQGILRWDVASGELQASLPTAQATVLCLAFHPTGQLLASGGIDRVVRLWEASSGRLLHVLNEPTNWIFSVAFSPMGNLLAAGTVGGVIYLWTVDHDSQGATIIQLQQRLEGHTIEVTSVAFSPDGQQLVSAACDETIRLWDVSTVVNVCRSCAPQAPILG